MNLESSPTVAIVDDDKFTRALLAGILDSAGYQITEYENGGTFLKSTATSVPDSVLLDLELGLGPTGVDVIRELAKRGIDTQIVVLTTHRTPRLAAPGEDHELQGLPYLVKADVTPDSILSALAGTATINESSSSSLPRITRQQIDLLKALADGKTAEQIAVERGSTVRAVHKLTQRLYASLGIDQSATDARTVAVTMYRTGQVTSTSDTST